MQSPALQPAYDLFQLGNLEQAEAFLLTVGDEHEADPEFWFLLAATRHRQGSLQQALEDVEKSLALEPTAVQALSARAQLLFDLGQPQEALAAYRAALAVQPEDPRLLTNLAIVHGTLGHLGKALEVYTQVLTVDPDFRDARLNRAVIYTRLKRSQNALDEYNRLLADSPDDGQVLANRADLLLAVGRLAEALDDSSRLQNLGDSSTAARFTRCVILAALGRLPEAQAIYDRLLAVDPTGVGQCFRRIGVELQADTLDFRLIWFWAAGKRQQVCNWTELDSLVAEIDRYAGSDNLAAFDLGELLFATLGLPVAPQSRLGIAQKMLRKIEAEAVIESPVVEISAREDKRIHIAYFGANFREHPTAYLTRRLFELHDRSRFKLSIYCLNPPDDSELYRDIAASSDSFVQLADLPSAQAARRIRDHGVQILIDIGMYSDGGRPEILAHRPAPIIASYLGTEMTSGADFVDYRISDAIMMETDRANWVEKVVTLPGCCYPYNDAEPIDDQRMSRAAAGLAEEAFVFCSFNNTFKIEPVVFGLWCNILKRVPASQIWILALNPTTQENLRREAENRDVDPKRLVFCGREPHARHLGRHRLADLFLDTLWCNAHTTALDSLWAGLPLLTCSGQTTASRAGSSVLQAAGLPELVTNSLDRYENLAVELATTAGKLAEIRQQLAHNRKICSLFDSRASTRKLEAAYRIMWQRKLEGLAPADIDIAYNQSNR